MPTLKFLPIPIRLPPSGVDVSATRTSLTGIGRRDKHNRNASNSRFVANKQSELIKRPVVCPASFSFASRLLVETIPNSGQVLKRQSRILLFSLNYQFLADIVVQPFLKATFSTGEPSQKSSRIPRAFALNVASNSTKSVSNRLDGFTAPGLTCRRGGNISPAQVHSNHLGRFTRWWSVQLNHKVDVIIPFSGLTQRCTGQGLTSKQGNLVAADGQLKVNPSTFECYSYNLFSFHVTESTNIQADRCGSKFVDLFDSLGVTNYPSNSLANVISFQPSCFSYWFINLVVKLGCVPTVVSFSYFQYLITSISKSPQSLIDLGSKLYRDYQLALNRQGLSHSNIITHPVTLMETSGVLNPISFPPIPPTAESRWVSRSFL